MKFHALHIDSSSPVVAIRFISKGSIMKKLWLLLCLAAIGLSACYVVPVRDQDGGYHGEREHRHEGERREEREREH
jgi:hypothetical protein